MYSALSYWHRLETTSSELLTDAFACSKELHNAGFNSWFTSINNIIKLLNVSDSTEQLTVMNSKAFKKYVKNILLDRYKTFWANFRVNNIDGKLRTYFTYKQNFEFESYLSIIRNFDKRRSLTKFRISSHRLKIERGRFSKPPVPVDNRVCDYCPSKIEDEFHFLIQCPKYDNVRNTLFSVGQKHCVNFTSLDDRNKFIWLLTTTDTYIISALSDFIFEAFQIHESL